jgi:uncharacterized protein (DUF2147 family)
MNMSPELVMRLSMLAKRHQTLSEIALDLYDRERHSSAASDIRAAIVSAVALADAAQKADDALTDPRIGTWSYMEGSEIYSDFGEASGALRSAIDQWNGVKLCTTT